MNRRNQSNQMARLGLLLLAGEHRRQRQQRPSVAAIHEAAHELTATAAGYKDVRAFVDRGGTTGRTYFLKRTDGARYRLGLYGLRKRVRILLAGRIAEALYEGGEVPDLEWLLAAEGVRTRGGGHPENPLDPFVAIATDEFGGNVDQAADWLAAMLLAARQETTRDLRRNWPQVLARAQQLDLWWKGQAA